MKLKQLPDDFFVEELTDAQPSADGEFTYYRLEKSGRTTPDAIKAIRKRWKLDLGRFSYGGLKDRHAHTVQYLTILRGPRRQLSQQGILLECLGHLPRPYTSQDFHGNRFRMIIRSVTDLHIERAAATLGEIRQCGVPNYFDDQRFGSVSDGAFVGKALVLADFERALRLALAAPYDFDRKAEKQEKAVLQTHWGDWETCYRKLRPGHVRSLVDHLMRNHDDFRGAIARLRPELRGLYLAAYQSHLWNRILARWLRDHIAADQLVEVDLRLGRVPMHRLLDPTRQNELASLQIALPTARGEIDAGDPTMPLMQAVLEEEGLTRDQLKVKGLREAFFSRGQRAALCLPTAMQWEDADDDLNQGRRKVMLGFELPRGSYATLIVKRAFSV